MLELTTKSRFTQIFLVVVLLVGWAFVGLGMSRLAASRALPSACDLFLRWTENRAVAQGKLPFGQVGDYQSHFTNVTAEWEEQRKAENTAVYPPWSYTLSMLFVPPVDWRISRLWFAICSGASLVSMVLVGGWLIGKRQMWVDEKPATEKGVGRFAIAAAGVGGVPAMLCLSNGQYGVVIAALLVLAVAAFEMGWGVVGGAILSLAMIKPNLGFLPALIVLMRLEKGGIAAGVAGIVAGTCATWALTGMDPVSMFRQAFENSAQFVSTSQTLGVTLLMDIGGKTAVRLLMPCVALGVAIIAFAMRRRMSWATAMGLAATASLFWTYTKSYDAPVLAVLGIALVMAWHGECRQGWRKLLATGWVMLTVSMVLPMKMAQFNLVWVQAIFAVAWVTPAVILMAAELAKTSATPALKMAEATV